MRHYVWSTLRYEIWMLSVDMMDKQEYAGISWKHKITNKEVLSRVQSWARRKDN